MMISKPFFSSSLLLYILLASFLLFLFLPTTAAPATQWKWKRKTTISWDTGNVTLLGAAATKNRSLSLTPPSWSAGRAIYSLPVRFLEGTARSPLSFSASFAFSIDPSPSFGDGIAFLITSDRRSLGIANGYMGLFREEDREGCGDKNRTVTIAVEFDTSLNTALHDINDNHVGIDVCSVVSVASIDAGKGGVNLRAGTPMTAWIEYRSYKKTMKVWVSYSGIRPLDPLLVAGVDLSHVFRESMYVGFAASNCRGGCRALHIVHRWKFSTYGFTSYPSPAPPDARPPVGEAVVVSPTRGSRAPWATLGVGGAVVFVFLATATIVVARQFKKHEERDDEHAPSGDQEREEPHVVRISLDVIRTATNGFHRSKIIGHGGSGTTTYEGVLPSGCTVVVEKFGRVERLTDTLVTELGAILDCPPHPNLVPLKGWCCEKDELLLVYESVPNGSLYEALTTKAELLPWDRRFGIVLGVASALSFLYEECGKPIVHGDVRTCNVLLDADHNAKLGGLGLALIDEPAGRMGYLAPEYARSGGVASEKTDVYGFGIVALEVATGRKPVDRGVVLVEWVWGLWEHRKLIVAADRRLKERFKRDEMMRVLMVGLSCAHPDCTQRPGIRKAIRMLKGTTTTTPLLVLPARKKPAAAAAALTPRSGIPQASEEDSVGASVPASSADDSSQWMTPCASFS